MNIGVKYCGGCNPKYDRKKFLKKLENEFSYEFEIAKEDKIYDIVIVLCGCSSCCAEHSQIQFKYEKILIVSDDNYFKIKEILKKYDNIGRCFL